MSKYDGGAGMALLQAPHVGDSARTIGARTIAALIFWEIHLAARTNSVAPSAQKRPIAMPAVFSGHVRRRVRIR